MSGQLLSIYISPEKGNVPHSVAHARLLAGRGLEGDRYAVGRGTFSANTGKRDVTLIEAEVIEAFAHDCGHKLDPAHSRRNLLTRGIRLNDLVGREFSVGSVPMRGLRLCEPCAHLARLTPLPVLPGLVHRGGLYAEILRDGDLKVGDVIEIAPFGMTGEVGALKR